MQTKQSGPKQMPVLMLVLCAFFAALMAVSSQISIPIEPVPICMTLFAVELCGALLNKKYALLSTLVYVLLGLVGVPVFANFKSGAAVLFGTTGGYIIGYLFCAFLIALIVEKWGREVWKQVLAMIVGVLVCYAFGTAWFMILSGRTLGESMALCVLPFLPGDAVKIALATALSVALCQPLQRIIRR